MTLALHGLGHFHPKTEISNDFLESLDIGTSGEWILERTGIASRRTVLPLDYIRLTHNRDVRAAAEAVQYSNAELGRRAAEQALARAGIDASEVAMVVAGGSVPETVTPSEAANIAAALGLEVPAIDVRNACTSFGTILYLLSLMDVTKLPGFVLVVIPETVTRSVSYDDRRAAVLWGDGAVAAVVAATSSSGGRAVVLETSLAGDPTGCRKVVVPWAGYFEQEGATVQSFAIRKTVRLLRALRNRYEEEPGGRTYFVGHQANLLMLDNVCRSCAVAPDRHLHNVVDFGNTAAAGAPSVMSEHWDDFEAGDHVAMVTVGAGLAWTTTMLRFQR